MFLRREEIPIRAKGAVASLASVPFLFVAAEMPKKLCCLPAERGYVVIRRRFSKPQTFINLSFARGKHIYYMGRGKRSLLLHHCYFFGQASIVRQTLNACTSHLWAEFNSDGVCHSPKNAHLFGRALSPHSGPQMQILSLARTKTQKSHPMISLKYKSSLSWFTGQCENSKEVFRLLKHK